MKILNKISIRKIKLGVDDHENFIQKLITWDRKKYFSSLEVPINLFNLYYDLYGIYQETELVGVSALRLEALPHYYLGIPDWDQVVLYPLEFQFALHPHFDDLVTREIVFQHLEEEVFPNYLYSELKMCLMNVDSEMRAFLDHHHFSLKETDKRGNAIYCLPQEREKIKIRSIYCG